LPGLIADPGAGEPVDVVEVVEKVLQIGRSVGNDGGHDAIEDGLVDACGVVVGLEQVRRDRGEQNRLADPLGSIRAEVSGDLTGAHREPNKCDLA
jgi:hypothetical protein